MKLTLLNGLEINCFEIIKLTTELEKLEEVKITKMIKFYLKIKMS